MDNIAQWLTAIGLGEHASRFSDQNIDWTVLPDLTDQDLRELGLSIGHRRKLLSAIAKTRGSSNPPHSATIEPQESSAERRQLSVLFCDLTDSTALAARIDAEDVRNVIRAYQSACTDIVHASHGFLAKFMGDGILVYFGYPQAHEDDAERAVRAGLEIVNAVDRLEECRRVGVRVRVGIATGPVVVGDLVGEGSAQERAVVGETPNIAARLQALAEPGTVMIAASTRRLIGNLFQLRDEGPRAVKGYSEPLATWAVEGLASVDSRFEALRTEQEPFFVGREQEFDLLLRRQELAKQGEGQIVLISGEAGIGKSRLAQKLAHTVEAARFTRIRYQCSPYHTSTALYPFIQQLRSAAGIEQSDANPKQLEKLEALVGRATPHVTTVAPLLAALLSISGDGHYPPSQMTAAERRRQTLQALLDQLEGLARQQPVLFMFEDLHWADATSHELLTLAVDRIRALPVFAIITSRPEIEFAWTEQPHVTKLALDRLRAPQVRAIVHWITGGKEIPQDVMNEIIGRTDGVPLFVEELTRTVLESGMLVEKQGGFELSGTHSTFSIPETLRDSLMARIDRLGPARYIAQIGATIGRNFSHEMVAAICDLDEVSLQQALQKLLDAQLIYRHGAPPDAIYTFKHALVQDTAYESLLRSTRQAMHARIADIIEKKGVGVEEIDFELLAQHCARANLAAKAISYWIKAAQRSLAESHLREAAPQLQAAIRLLSNEPECVERQRQELGCEVMLAQALIGTKGYGAAETLQAWTRARELAVAVGSAEQQFATTYGLWVGQYAQGDLNRTLSLSEECLRAAQASGDRIQLCVAHRMNGIALFVRGTFGRAQYECASAIKYYDEAQHAKLANQLGHDLLTAAVSFNSLSLWTIGLPDQAQRAMELALSHSRHLNHPPSMAYAYWHAGIIGSLMLRDDERVAEFSDALLALALKYGFAVWEHAARAAKGWLSARKGGGKSAAEDVHAALNATRKAGTRVNETILLALLGEAQTASGDASGALASLEEGIAFARSSEQTFWLSQLERLLAAVQLGETDGGRQRAEKTLMSAIETATRQGAPAWQLRAAIDLAPLLAADGRAVEGQSILLPIYSGFREGSDTRDVKAAKVLLESLLS